MESTQWQLWVGVGVEVGEVSSCEKLDKGPSIGNDVFSKIASSGDREPTIPPRIDKQQCLETLMPGMISLYGASVKIYIFSFRELCEAFPAQMDVSQPSRWLSFSDI